MSKLLATSSLSPWMFALGVPGLRAHAPTLESPAQAGAQFGFAVAGAVDVDGDSFSDVIVGEPFFDGEFLDEGRVLVYRGSASGPGSVPSWVKMGGQRGAHFGAALAGVDLNGDGFGDLAIGAPDFDHRALTPGPGAAIYVGPPFPGIHHDEGRIYVFLGSSTGLASAPALVQGGVENREQFGIAVARAGDVNGDGYDDLIVGATGTGAEQGAAFVFHGSAAGPAALPDWIVLSRQRAALFGRAVAAAGDLNGDGYDDVLVGAPDAGPLHDGKVFSYNGSAGGLATLPVWMREERRLVDLDGSDFGWAVAGLGDTDGDGFPEIAVGDPGWDGLEGIGSGHDNGVLRVYRGSASGVSAVDSNSFQGQNSDDRCGISIAPMGDLDGDGLADVVVGVPDSSGLIRVHHGFAYYLLGGGAMVHAPDGQLGASFGFAVAAAGDVDGDGLRDLIVGEPLRNTLTVFDQGRVCVYRGIAADPNVEAVPTWTFEAP